MENTRGKRPLQTTKITKRTHFGIFHLPANKEDSALVYQTSTKNEPIFWGAATCRRFLLTGRHVCQFQSRVMPAQSK